MNYFDFASQIKTLKNNQQYAEALAFFKENKSNFEQDKIKSDNYLLANLLTCLRKTGNCKAAYQLLDIYQVAINENSSEFLLPSYAWVLYDDYKQENNMHTTGEHLHLEEDFFETDQNDTAHAPLPVTNVNERILKVLPLLQNIDNDFARSPLNLLLQTVCKTEKKKPSVNWSYLNNLCASLNPEILDTSCKTIEVERRGQKKQMELASIKEIWYATKTKALYKLRLFEECFHLSKEALEKLEKFHYSNDVWLARRIALSKKEMGNPQEALAELETILRKKKEWFIYKEISQIHKELGHLDLAYDNAIEGLVAYGDLEYKVDLIHSLAYIFESQDQKELAIEHYQLEHLLRTTHDWNITEPLLLKMQQLNFGESELSLKDLTKKLKAYWNKNSQQAKREQNAQEGFIKKILNNNEKGINGFLTLGGKDYYFNLPARHKLCKKIDAHSKVKCLIENPDAEKPKAKILSLIN